MIEERVPKWEWFQNPTAEGSRKAPLLPPEAGEKRGTPRFFLYSIRGRTSPEKRLPQAVLHVDFAAVGGDFADPLGVKAAGQRKDESARQLDPYIGHVNIHLSLQGVSIWKAAHRIARIRDITWWKGLKSN